MDKIRTLIDFQHVLAFLENNQLVQACAIVQRIENIFQNEIVAAGKAIETHPLWPSQKAVMRARAKILAGDRVKALEEWKTANRLLAGVF